MTRFPVLLQRLELCHADELYALQRDEDLENWMSTPRMSNREEAVRYIEQSLKNRQEYQFAMVTPFGTLVGLQGLVKVGKITEHWFWTGAPFRERGLATAAGEKVLRWAAENWGLTYVLAAVHTANHPSQRVLSKLGYVPVPLGLTNDFDFYMMGPIPQIRQLRRLVNGYLQTQV